MVIRANLSHKSMKGLEKMRVEFQDKFANTPKTPQVNHALNQLLHAS